MRFWFRGSRQPTADDLIRATTQQLEIFEAFVAALERRTEVLELLDAASDLTSAEAQLIDLLEVSPIGARAVLDMQLRRLVTGERVRLVEQRDEIRRALSDLRSGNVSAHG